MIQASKRLEKIPPYLFAEMARIKRQAIAEGKDVIDLGIGDPDQPTPAPIVEALYQAAQNPITHRYDESAFGWPEFLKSAANWYERQTGVSLDVDSEIMLLIGSKEGLAHLAWAYLDPGDIAIVPNPGYTVYKVNSQMAGADVYEMPLLAENGFLPDLDAIPAEVADKAKLLFLNYPNNPTGAVATREFYEKAVEFARKHQLLLVNDCAYFTCTFDGFRHPSLLEIPGAKEVTLEFHSLSKMFNMTGWRLGFAIGNKEAVATLNRLKSNLDSKQFPALDLAAAYALDHVSNEETFKLYTRRRDILVEGLQSLGFKIEKPKASFYLWLPIPQGYRSMEFAKKLLEEASVLVIPGVGYGDKGEGYVRMSLTVSGDQNGERMQEAVERIRQIMPALV